MVVSSIKNPAQKGLMQLAKHTPPREISTVSPWMENISTQFSSTQSVIRACFGWLVELGIREEMPHSTKKNLALINASAFASLMLALPATFVLMVMGFGHPFSLLIAGSLAACLTLGLNGAGRVEWAKTLFAYSPTAIILTYTLLELSSQGLSQPLNYLLARQGLCFALLLPVIIYGLERRKLVSVVGICLAAYLLFDAVSMRLGAFQFETLTGVNHGLFTLLSLLQYAALAGCVIYVQRYLLQQTQLVQRNSEKLKALAIRDGLTGLFNHRFMEEMVADAINRARRSSTPLSLLMIDVDAFKQVNDSFGHNAGDEVLVRLTRLLSSSTRSTDYLGRWGGDELLLLLTDTNLAGAENLAEKLRSLVESQVFPYGPKLTLSIGAGECMPADDPSSFIARADAALYRAKRKGRNRVEGRSDLAIQPM